VHFVQPSVDGIPREIFRSTGTKEIAAAKRIGAQIIESFWTDAGRGAERLQLRNDHATIGELIERYRKCRAAASNNSQHVNAIVTTSERTRAQIAYVLTAIKSEV